MNKVKKFLVTVITLVFLVCGCFVGCTLGETKKKTYDVSIRVRSSEGDMWEIPPEMDRINIERSYDGKEVRYTIFQYKVHGHPEYGDSWLDTTGAPGAFHGGSMLYTDEQGNQEVLRKAKGKGVYSIEYEICSPSTSPGEWNHRFIYVVITIK